MISERNNSRNDKNMVIRAYMVFIRLVNVEELWV